MSKESLSSHGRAGWRRFGVLGVLAVLIAVTTGGCCSWARNNCELPPADYQVHAAAFSLVSQDCAGCNCVCMLPNAFRVTAGDKVSFINSSPYPVEIDVTPPAFLEGNSFRLDPGDSKLVSIPADYVAGGLPTRTVAINVNVLGGGKGCPGLPGPRIDVDRP